MTNNEVEKRLWGAADQLRANSKLKASEYSMPVLGLIFLRYADSRFTALQKVLEAERVQAAGVAPGDLAAHASTAAPLPAGQVALDFDKLEYQARGVLYVPEAARFSNLLKLPEGADVAGAISDAMKAIEAENEDLKDVLPKTYNRLDTRHPRRTASPSGSHRDRRRRLRQDLRILPGQIRHERGAEGRGVLHAHLHRQAHRGDHRALPRPHPGSRLRLGRHVRAERPLRASATGRTPPTRSRSSVRRRIAETVRLCRMNLAVHGLSADIRQANTYYEDLHSSPGRFDFVMANPPFNVNKVDKERIKDDPRFPFGIPKPDNANYLWIQLFYSALNASGTGRLCHGQLRERRPRLRAADPRSLLREGGVDVMVSIGPNFFYTVTLPCTLWFLDKGKNAASRSDKVLFIDARDIYRQLDRAHRDFTPEQLEFLANIVRLYRGEEPETAGGSAELVAADVPRR